MMEVSRPPEYARTTFLMFSFFMMIAPFKNTLLFSDAYFPFASSCICVSVDAFIIRRAAFSSMPKTAKPYTDLTSVLVQFVSLCVICRIYSHFMHLRSIYSGRSASPAPASACGLSFKGSRRSRVVLLRAKICPIFLFFCIATRPQL